MSSKGIPYQYDKIWRTNWKYLIILDACRYDYFEKVYKDYLVLREGKLEKVLSPGSATYEWIKEVFKGKKCDDIIYISANPYINSKGIPYRGFNPKDILHFHKVIDVWDWGWNESLGTVHPREVNKAVMIALRLYPNKRFIIHYAQPHYPYLSITGKVEVNELKITKDAGVIPARLRVKAKGFIRWRVLVRMLGMRWGLKLANALLGAPPSYVKLVAKKLGLEGLRSAYESNLRIVLEYVQELMNKLHGKIVITSDHGELLGEYDMYEHPEGVRLPELVEVPWLEIERS